MGVPPMSITSVSPVETGPKPALSEAEGMALRLMGKMPMLLRLYSSETRFLPFSSGR
jgi:hypothetical protein